MIFDILYYSLLIVLFLADTIIGFKRHSVGVEDISELLQYVNDFIYFILAILIIITIYKSHYVLTKIDMGR